MFTVAVWFWLAFTNHPEYPEHVFLKVAPDGTCISEVLVVPDVDCRNTHLTVAMPSEDGKRIAFSRLRLSCVEKDHRATISVSCNGAEGGN